jgi:hypothetical protein
VAGIITEGCGVILSLLLLTDCVILLFLLPMGIYGFLLAVLLLS